MKKTVIIAVAMLTECALATPSSNNFHAVTNDWYNGNFSNVYELAQMRLAANSNDVVGAYLMLDWDFRFSGTVAVSNSISRVLDVSMMVQNPVFSNAYATVRERCILYRDEFLPTLTDEHQQEVIEKSCVINTPLVNEVPLKILWDNNLWGEQ